MHDTNLRSRESPLDIHLLIADVLRARLPQARAIPPQTLPEQAPPSSPYPHHWPMNLALADLHLWRSKIWHLVKEEDIQEITRIRHTNLMQALVSPLSWIRNWDHDLELAKCSELEWRVTTGRL